MNFTSKGHLGASTLARMCIRQLFDTYKSSQKWKFTSRSVRSATSGRIAHHEKLNYNWGKSTPSSHPAEERPEKMQ